MPTYVFEARDGTRTEKDYRVGTAPDFVFVGTKRFKRIIVGVGLTIAPHMDSRSHGARDANEKQAEYLKSDRWYKERQKIDKKGGTVRYGADIKD